MGTAGQLPNEFDLDGAKVALQEVVELHRQHQDDTSDDDTRARLVSAVSGMEWTMQDLEDYGQRNQLSGAELDFQRTTRATLLEVRQALASSTSPSGHEWDMDGYDTEEDAVRQRTDQDMDVSRHTAELHAEPVPTIAFRSLCCCWRRSTTQYQQLDRESVDQP